MRGRKHVKRPIWLSSLPPVGACPAQPGISPHAGLSSELFLSLVLKVSAFRDMAAAASAPPLRDVSPMPARGTLAIPDGSPSLAFNQDWPGHAHPSPFTRSFPTRPGAEPLVY